MDSTPATVEELEVRLRTHVRERQELRATDAGAKLLERNRQQIVRDQWALGQALIARYLPALGEQADAA